MAKPFHLKPQARILLVIHGVDKSLSQTTTAEWSDIVLGGWSSDWSGDFPVPTYLIHIIGIQLGLVGVLEKGNHKELLFRHRWEET